MMGSPDSEPDREDDETRHLVKITRSFYLGVYEITQQQFDNVMENRPWQGKDNVQEGADYLASYVNWVDAAEFCRKLSMLEGVEYRLPTEAQWEYACRGGTKTVYNCGDDASALGRYVWFGHTSSDIGENYPHRVGQKLPNPWGLYDMHGNLREWCQDWLAPFDGNKPVTNSKGPAKAPAKDKYRLLRGGAFYSLAKDVRSADRYGYTTTIRFNSGGFRVARRYNAAP